jgi:hypothetical protein
MCVRLISWVFRNKIMQRMVRKEKGYKKQKISKPRPQENSKY